MDLSDVQDRIEKYVREQFGVGDGDLRFGPTVDLYESGYVDSVGVVELLAFIEEEFGVEVSEHDLVSPAFSSVEGIASIVRRLI